MLSPVLKTQHSIAQLSDDDRKLLLVALKVLYHNLERSLAYGYPITGGEVQVMVRRLGGDSRLL